MKFKNLRNITEQYSKLNEWGDERVAPEWNDNTAVGGVSSDHMYIEKKDNRDRLNFWLKTMMPSTKPVFDVHDYLINVRTKLNLAGYDIPVNRQTEIGEKMEFHVSQFGGREGMNEQGQYFKDCGISNRNNGKGMKLVVNVSGDGAAKTVDMSLEESI